MHAGIVVKEMQQNKQGLAVPLHVAAQLRAVRAAWFRVRGQASVPSPAALALLLTIVELADQNVAPIPMHAQLRCAPGCTHLASSAGGKGLWSSGTCLLLGASSVPF